MYCGGCSPVSLSIPLPMREWEEKEGASSASSPPSCSGDGFATLGASEEVQFPAACQGPGSQGAPGHQPGHVLCMRDHLDPHHPRPTLPPHIHNSISCGVCMFVSKQLILALESLAPPVCT